MADTATTTAARADAEGLPSRPPISVVVVTFRNAATLPGALAALKQDAPPGTELLIVENGGDSAVELVVRATWPDAVVMVNAQNRGFAAGVNQGVRRATGRAILLLNPDAEVEPGAIAALQAGLARLPDAGIVAPRLRDTEGRPVLACYPFLSPLDVAWRHLQLRYVLPDLVTGRYRRQTLDPARVEPVPVAWAQGACWLIRREMLDQVGPLDEEFFLYAEEVDLALRAARRGWRTYLIPTASVRHAEGSSSRQVVPLKLASHYLSKVVYFAKHHGPAEQAAVRAILLLDLGLRMAYRAVGAARGRPPDARQRLRAYARIARMIATLPTDRLIRAWHRLGNRS
jgi:N-acetylglucosaminyl-diphospho-decaprenol L-rhamnosyltransferase